MSTHSKKKPAPAAGPGKMNAIGLVINSANPLSTLYGGIGTSHTFTQGSVIFSGSGSNFSENNSQLFWDNTNNRLYIGADSTTQAFVQPGFLNVQSNSYSPTPEYLQALNFYTNQDAYPVISITNYAHNANGILFDAYVNTSGFSSYSSSSSIANYYIQNVSESLEFLYSFGTPQGSVIAWESALGISAATGNVGITNSLFANAISATTTVTANEFIGSVNNNPYIYTTCGGL